MLKVYKKLEFEDKIIKIKEQEKIVNGNEKIILPDDEHNDHIDLDGVNLAICWIWWKECSVLAHMLYIIIFEFNQF